MSRVSEIQKKMAAVDEKITTERKKSTKRDRKKIALLQIEYSNLQKSLSRALAGLDDGKKSSQSKIQEPPSPPQEEEEEEDDTEEDDDDD